MARLRTRKAMLPEDSIRVGDLWSLRGSSKKVLVLEIDCHDAQGRPQIIGLEQHSKRMNLVPHNKLLQRLRDSIQITTDVREQLHVYKEKRESDAQKKTPEQ